MSCLIRSAYRIPLGSVARTRAFVAIGSISSVVDRQRLMRPRPHSCHSSEVLVVGLSRQAILIRPLSCTARFMATHSELPGSTHTRARARSVCYIATGRADLPERLSVPVLILPSHTSRLLATGLLNRPACKRPVAGGAFS